MPIVLTTPFSFDPGHGQPVESYGEMKIVEFVCGVQESQIRMRCQYGDTVDGTWVPGNAPESAHVVEDRPAAENVPATSDYTDLVAASRTTADDEITPGDGGHSIYVGAARELYEWLIARGIYDGTIT